LLFLDGLWLPFDRRKVLTAGLSPDRMSREHWKNLEIFKFPGNISQGKNFIKYINGEEVLGQTKDKLELAFTCLGLGMTGVPKFLCKTPQNQHLHLHVEVETWKGATKWWKLAISPPPMHDSTHQSWRERDGWYKHHANEIV